MCYYAENKQKNTDTFSISKLTHVFIEIKYINGMIAMQIVTIHVDK